MAGYFLKSPVEKGGKRQDIEQQPPFHGQAIPAAFPAAGGSSAGTRAILRTSAALCCHPCKQLPLLSHGKTRATRGKHRLGGCICLMLVWELSNYPAAPGASSSKLSPAVPASQRRTRPARRSRNHTQDRAAPKGCGILNMPPVCGIQLGLTRAVHPQQPWEPGASNCLTGHVQHETIFRNSSWFPWDRLDFVPNQGCAPERQRPAQNRAWIENGQVHIPVPVQVMPSSDFDQAGLGPNTNSC